MKEVYKYIMATAALLFAAFTFGPAALAQVEYAKSVSGPDANGVYTISLEAYVTGNVTVTEQSIPADIVLVLDVSSSMTESSYGSYTTRLAALRAAVLDFVDVINKNDTEKAPEGSERLGNQIAIVPFGGTLKTTGNLAPLGLTPLSSLSTITTKVNNLTSTISKTNPAVGLEKAKDYLDGVANRNSTKTVVLFTDGCPAEEGPTKFKAEYAFKAVNTAYEIKNADYSPTIFTIGLFTDLGTNETQVMNYMNYASSNYPKAQATAYSTSTNPESVTYSPGDGTYGGDYFQMAGDNDLSSIFKAIAEASGGSSMPAASSSSVMVDIVTNSFNIPTNASLGSVKVYKDTCTQASKDADISFAPKNSEGWVDITGKVTLKTHQNDPEGTPEGEVSVSGFDYGANWCGWDDNVKGPHGNKLVLEIPITLNDDAVGGPRVETNADGAQLILKDESDNELGRYDFVSPTLPIPVSIWIQKQGLVGDDSAVFTLRRSPFVEDFDPETAKWDTFTKIVVNEKNMVTITDSEGNSVKVVKISGLDPNYYYKIEEDAWGFGYTYQNKGIQYTVGDNLKNPFVFVNTPKDVKKAEAVVRNVFETRTTEITTSK